MSRLHTRLLASTAVALCAANGAWAQETPVELGTLVLDWENIGRPINETSAANTVVTQEEVERTGNRNVLEAIEGTPNVVTENGAQLPVIRGIDGTAGQFGAIAASSGSFPRINVVVDGVSRVSGVNGTVGALSSPWDVQQIEVARGPQTTLGGRSSLAGAINVVTNDPVFDTEGAVRFSYATREGEPLYGLSGVYNAPLSDSVAVRFSFDGLLGDSFVDVVDPSVASIRDNIENIDAATFRAKALFAPESIPGLEIVFSYEYEFREGLNTEETDLGSDDFSLSEFAANVGEERLEQDIFSIRASYELSSNWTFEGRLSYTDSRNEILPTNVNFDLDQDFENIQGEVFARYEGSGFLRRGVIGFAYENQTEDALNDTLGNPAGFLLDVEGQFINRSIFGEAEFALRDDLFFFAGGRYEEQDIERSVLFQFFSTANATSRTDDTRLTPRVGLRYEPTEALTLGYQYSEGFRPGSVDFDVFSPTLDTTTFGGETLRQHEVWARFNDPAGRFSFDAAAFYYRLDDAQVSGAGPGFLLGNVPEAEGMGLELSGSIAVGQNGRFYGGLGFVETELTDVGSDPDLIAAAGQSLPNTAGITATFGYSYVSPNGWDFGIDVRHVGDRAPSFLGEDDLPSYTTFGLRAGYDTTIYDRSVRIEGFVENLFDELVLINVDPASGIQEVGDPLTVGFSATMRF